MHRVIHLVLILTCACAILRTNGQVKIQEINHEKLLITLIGEAQQAYFLKRFQTALRKWNQASTIYQQRGDSLNMAHIKLKTGKIYTLVGDYQNAFQALNEAQTIFSSIKNEQGLLRSLLVSGRVNFNIARYYNAINNYKAGLLLARKLKATNEKWQLLTGLGQVFNQLGDSRQARQYYLHALRFVRENSDHWWEARIISYLGILNYYQSNLDSAQTYFSTALDIQKQIKDDTGMKDNYLNLGIVQFSQDRLAAAYPNLKQALTLQKQLKDFHGEITTELRLGDIAYQELNFRPASHRYHSAYDNAVKAGHRDLQAKCLQKLGYLYFSQQRYNASKEKLDLALQIALNIDDPVLLWRIYHGLGMIAQKQEHYSEAFQQFNQAISYIELTEPDKIYLNQPTEFTKNETDVYLDAMDAAQELARGVQSQKWIKALFLLSEKMQARQLYYKLQKIDLRPGNPETRKEILLIKSYANQIQAVKKLLIKEKNQELLNQNISKIISLKNYLLQLKQRKRQLQDNLYAGHPGYRSLFSTARSSLTELQQSLWPGQVALKYIVMERETYIIKILPDTALIFRSQVKSKKLKRELAKFHDNINSLTEALQKSGSNSLTDYVSQLNPILKELTHYLLDPVKPFLSSGGTLIILPGPELSAFPFETLLWDSNSKKSVFLVEQLPVHYKNHSDTYFQHGVLGVSIAANFHELSARQINGSPAGRLKNINRQSWKSFHRLVDPDSTALIQLFENQGGIFHFWQSGKWLTHEPNASWLELAFHASKQNWYLPDWFKLEVPQQSLVCFADFSISLSFDRLNNAVFVEILRILGSQQTLFSHWHTPPDLQDRFFTRFYQHLTAGGTIPQALQTAKKKLLNQKKYRHPYFWSGFLLF